MFADCTQSSDSHSIFQIAYFPNRVLHIAYFPNRVGVTNWNCSWLLVVKVPVK